MIHLLLLAALFSNAITVSKTTTGNESRTECWSGFKAQCNVNVVGICPWGKSYGFNLCAVGAFGDLSRFVIDNGDTCEIVAPACKFERTGSAKIFCEPQPPWVPESTTLNCDALMIVTTIGNITFTKPTPSASCTEGLNMDLYNSVLMTKCKAVAADQTSNIGTGECCRAKAAAGVEDSVVEDN